MPVRRRPLLHPGGLILGTALGALALTPSLVPRTGVLQGVVCGVTLAVGYLLGALLGLLVRPLARRTGRRLTGAARVLLGVVVLLVWAVAGFLGFGRQADQAELLGLPARRSPAGCSRPGDARDGHDEQCDHDQRDHAEHPSALSFLLDGDRVRDAGTTMFDAVRAAVDALPPGEPRPEVVAFGESLGSLGSQAAFPTPDAVRTRTDGAVWNGPPNSSALWHGLVADRDAGSPEVRPVVGAGARSASAAGRSPRS